MQNKTVFLSDTDVAERYGVSRQTIWRWVKTDATFPKSIKLSPGCTRWNIADIEYWEKVNYSVDKTEIKPIVNYEIKENKHSGRLLTKEELLENSFDANHSKLCGIYFLIKNNEIIYIGQSVNILQRLFEHRVKKPHERFSYIECEVDKLNLLESLYIHKFNPVGNGKNSNKYGAYGGVHSPIPIKDLMPILIELGEVQIN